jgi:hypothetical protein
MKPLFIFVLSVCSLKAVAYDCSKVRPFAAGGSQKVSITVSKFAWSDGVETERQICQSSTKLDWYDVRGREEEAYYCLKPGAKEVIVCKTTLNGDEAEVQIVPASWIRNWEKKDIREYRFHAYVLKEKEPDYFYDIFARSLQDSLKAKHTIVEGALKTGPGNPEDGFWLRAEFQK